MLLHICLYYLSFVPLWILVIINETFVMVAAEEKRILGLVVISLLVAFSLYFCIVLLFALNVRKKDNTRSVRLESVKEDKFSVAEFMMSFVLPFWAFDLNSIPGMICFVVFFLLLGVVCIRHRIFCCNIVLEILGYRIYECSYSPSDNAGQTINKKVLCKVNLQKPIEGNLIEKKLSNDYSLFIVQNDDSKTHIK